MVYFQMGATQSDALAGGYGQLQIGGEGFKKKKKKKKIQILNLDGFTSVWKQMNSSINHLNISNFGSKKDWIFRYILENYRYFIGLFRTEVKP